VWVGSRMTIAVGLALYVVGRRGARGRRLPVPESSEGLEARHTVSVAAKFPVLCDLDGVVWLMREPIPGSPEAIRALRDAGHDVWFVTNNSHAPVDEQAEALEAIGVPPMGRLLTAAEAAAACVSSGDRVVLGGGPGVEHELARRGVEVVARGHEQGAGSADCDAVVVGIHFDFDYSGLRRLSAAARRCGRLIATNGDVTYPTSRGEIPGGGAIVAAVAAASGLEPVIAGKPHEPMARLVRERLGLVDLSGAWMVGDRRSTDGTFAARLGCRFALVESGVDTDDAHGVEVHLRSASLAEAVPHILGAA